jgi:hypothetical protein
MQAHFASDGVSPSMRLSGVDVYANFNYSDGKEVKSGSHGMTPTSRTLDKLTDALGMLHQAVSSPFFAKLFEVKGQWNIAETANGYTFTRVDAILPEEKKTKKNVQ